jgi:hypothetical protein
MKTEIHLDLDSDGSPLTTGRDDGKGMRGMTDRRRIDICNGLREQRAMSTAFHEAVPTILEHHSTDATHIYHVKRIRSFPFFIPSGYP